MTQNCSACIIQLIEIQIIQEGRIEKHGENMILDKHKRDVVKFDVQNELHRMYARHFIQMGKWGDLPIKFDTAGLRSSLAAHISNLMLHYYVEKETTESATKSS